MAKILQRATAQDRMLYALLAGGGLYQILEKLEHAKGGFDILPCFRITYLQFLVGVRTEPRLRRFTKLRDECDFGLNWAEKIGAGFEMSQLG
jgi:hypothetical protein